MSQIMTVLGPISPEELGFTSMHEHVLLDLSVWRRKFAHLIPEDQRALGDQPLCLDNIGLVRRNYFLLEDNVHIDDEDVMTAEAADFKASGGSALVDMSVPGLRINLPGIQRISKKSGVHIVTTTGRYAEPSWPDRLRLLTLEEHAREMRAEIETGIEDTGIKAGHIKIGMYDLNEHEERALRAAGRVASETGLSVSIHPGSGIGNDGRRILRILVEEGTDPKRVVLAHSDSFFSEYELRNLALRPETWGLRLDYAKELLDRGANLALDCFGHYWDVEFRNGVNQTDWQRLGGLVALIQKGYSSQIVLGTDVCLKMLVRRYGGEGYCRLTKSVVPTLRTLGVSDFDIRQMTVVNPARLLSH